MKQIAKILFLFFVLLQVISIFIGRDLQEVRFFKFTLFQLGIIITTVFVAYGFFKEKYKYEQNRITKIVFGAIFLYCLYQIFFLLPISYLFQGLVIGQGGHEVFKRFSFLLIPLIYWFVLPSFKSYKIPIRFINYSSIILFMMSIYNYINDIYMITSTGELRVISGVAAIIFVFTLITNLSLFSAKRDNIFYIVISLIGLVFVNHRSAYLGIALIFFVSGYIYFFHKIRNKKVLYSFVLFLVLLYPLSNISYIKENFISRAAASFDVEDPNARDRMLRWGMSFDYFLSNPINGSMLETKYYADDEALKGFYAPHNSILEILSTQGIIGFAFISIILFYVFKIAFKNKHDPITLQMIYIIIFYLFYSLFNVTFFLHWNVLILMFCSSMILYRNKMLTSKLV